MCTVVLFELTNPVPYEAWRKKKTKDRWGAGGKEEGEDLFAALLFMGGRRRRLLGRIAAEEGIGAGNSSAGHTSRRGWGLVVAPAPSLSP